VPVFQIPLYECSFGEAMALPAPFRLDTDRFAGNAHKSGMQQALEAEGFAHAGPQPTMVGMLAVVYYRTQERLDSPLAGWHYVVDMAPNPSNHAFDVLYVFPDMYTLLQFAAEFFVPRKST
jgi:hypothetical protein